MFVSCLKLIQPRNLYYANGLHIQAALLHILLIL